MKRGGSERNPWLTKNALYMQLNLDFIFLNLCKMLAVSFWHIFHIISTASVVKWLACSYRVRKVVRSIPGRVESETLKLVFAASPLSTRHLGVRANTGPLEVRIMCLGKMACFPVDCCFRELAR